MAAARGCRVSPTTRDSLARGYTALHEGLGPRSIDCAPWSPPGRIVAIGRAARITYYKRIPGERGAREFAPPFEHPWKTYARPALGLDARGHVHFAAGRTETRRRGIEDRVPKGRRGSAYLTQPHVQPERWLGRPPKSWIVLGKLASIVYDAEVGPGRPAGQKRLAFDRAHAPDLAHDEHGNLYAVGGSYRIDAPNGEKSTMARRRRRHSMHSLFGMGRRHRRRHNAYANPSRGSSRRSGYTVKSVLDHSVKTMMAGLGVGVVGLLSAVGLDKAFSYATGLNGTWKAIGKIGSGLLAGAAISFAPEGFEPVSMGAMAGGSIDGGLDLWNIYIVPWMNSLGQPASSTGTPTPGTAPAQRALGAGGLPRGYEAFGPANCAVPQQRAA